MEENVYISGLSFSPSVHRREKVTWSGSKVCERITYVEQTVSVSSPSLSHTLTRKRPFLFFQLLLLLVEFLFSYSIVGYIAVIFSKLNTLQ